ncbi:MAG: flagellar hook-associated protein FlgK [Oligoflexia bacterium]|nr:flagellar hook-associated protein FlgK [Oligoflexia bacterium]
MSVNYNSRILNNAVRALSVNQAVIAATGNNIANVNTPGYARRTVQLETNVEGSVSGTLRIGAGVNISNVVRQVDEYMNRIVRDAQGDAAASTVQQDYMKRVEALFPLAGSNSTIGSSITAFFEAADNLSTNPSSIELRANFVARAGDVVDSIRTTYNSIANLQTEIDQRLGSELDSVNSIADQIAGLNTLISRVEVDGISTANDERDQRDRLLEQLSEKISFQSVESSDGSISIQLANGFSLVSGATSRHLEVTNSPSFATGSAPPSLAGGLLNYIVYDYDQSDSGAAHVDLTSIIGNGSGTLAGLLAVRGINDANNTSAFDGEGVLVGLASRVEAVARTFLVNINLAYLGPDRIAGGDYNPSSGDLDGNVPDPFGLFTVDLDAGDDLNTDGDERPELSDLTALGYDNFASRLNLTFTDPRRVAAARDLSGGALTPIFAEGDGQNMEALAALKDQEYTFAVGSYSLRTTFSGAYNETVSSVGNSRARADLDAKVYGDNLVTSQNKRDEISAVNLDEEFTNLIKFQKSFQASARLIKTAGDLLDTIVSLI